MSKNNGGPAFPYTCDSEHCPHEDCKGMALRDYFAVKADLSKFSAGLREGEILTGRPYPPDSDPVDQLRWQFEIVAAVRYLAADAMFAARDADSAGK